MEKIKKFLNTDENKKILKLLHFWIKSEGGRGFSMNYYVDEYGSMDSWFSPYFMGMSVSSKEIPNRFMNFLEEIFNIIVNDDSILDELDSDFRHTVSINYTTSDQLFEITDIRYELQTRDYYSESKIKDKEIIEELIKWKSEGNELVRVSFNGSGDSGYIDSFGYGINDDHYNLPAGLENFLYDMLEREHAGWENNEGAQGEFGINTTNYTVNLNFGLNEEVSDNNDLLSFKIEF